MRRWRLNSKVKAIAVTLFLFSTLFISYQVIYYSKISQYETIQEEKVKKEKNDILAQEEAKALPSSQQNFQGFVVARDNRGKPSFSTGVIGVSREYWHLYRGEFGSKKNFFRCFASGRYITWEKVNDDFCDCPADGSDEPSTAACMNGKFYCTKSRNAYPEFIPSSRVLDGICDCCDGSDEYASAVTCIDHCSH